MFNDNDYYAPSYDSNLSKLPPYHQEYPVYDFSRQNSLLRHDIEYLNTLYPNEINELKQLVVSECDRMDYDGSMMYDECPDKVMFSKKCGEICAMADCSCKYAKKCKDNNFLKDLISVMLADEMYKRRKEHHHGTPGPHKPYHNPHNPSMNPYNGFNPSHNHFPKPEHNFRF